MLTSKLEKICQDKLLQTVVYEERKQLLNVGWISVCDHIVVQKSSLIQVLLILAEIQHSSQLPG